MNFWEFMVKCGALDRLRLGRVITNNKLYLLVDWQRDFWPQSKLFKFDSNHSCLIALVALHCKNHNHFT